MVNFPVRIIGGREHLVTHQGQEHIVSVKRPAVLYPVGLLKEAVTLYRDKPVYRQHWQDLGKHSSAYNNLRSSLGRIVDPQWSEVDKSILAFFEPANERIEEQLFKLWDTGRLPEISGNVIVRKNPSGNFEIVVEVMEVESVDMVDTAIAGGRFLEVREYKRILESEAKLQRIMDSVQKSLRPQKDVRMTDYFSSNFLPVKETRITE